MKMMKWLIWAGWLLGAAAGATTVSTGAVRHPVNLGPEADPGRIPIGWMPNRSNYGYGVLELITQPFPLVHGGWRWEGGVELNGNLPSAFGISVEPEDSTNVPASPVTVRVRRQAKPGYSPYSKEQVLLATLRCLLDSVAAGSKQPLKVMVVTEDPADEALQRFSGEYVTRTQDEEEPTPLPGCRVEVGNDGVGMVVFDKAAEVPAKGGGAQVWLPFPIEGDVDGAHLLLPVWAGNLRERDPLEMLGMPWPVIQERFQSGGSNPDANSATRRRCIYGWGVKRAQDGVEVYAGVSGPAEESTSRELAVLCWAAVISAAPTEEQPLKIRLRIRRELEPVFQEWMDEGGWEKSALGDELVLEARFVWDPEQRMLTAGSIPGCRAEPGRDGGWGIVESGEAVAIDPVAGEEVPAGTGDLPQKR